MRRHLQYIMLLCLILFVPIALHGHQLYRSCVSLYICNGSSSIRNAILAPDTAKLYSDLRLVELYLDKSADMKLSSDALKAYVDSSKIVLKRLMDGMTSLTDETSLLKIYSRLGHIYQHSGSFTTAMDFYFDALEILDSGREIGEKDRILYYTQTCRNIGICFSYNNFDKSLLYHKKSLSEAGKYLKKYPGHDAQREYVFCMNNMGTLYLNAGRMDVAEKYFKRTLGLLRGMKDMESVYPAVYNNMGIISYEKGEREKSLDYFQQSLRLCLRFDDKANRANTLLNMGELYLLEKDYRTSMQKTDSAIALCGADHVIKYKALLLQSSCLEGTGDWRGALSAMKKANDEKIKIDGNETIQLSLSKELDYLYNTFQRNRDATLQKERYRYYIILGLALSMFVVACLLYWNQKVVAQKKIIAEQNLKLTNDNLMLENRMLQQNMKLKEKEANLHIQYLLEKKKALAGHGVAVASGDDSSDNMEYSAEELEVILQGMHESFYKNLYKKHPDLTRSEKRLCSFLRLGLTTKEIAALTHQQISSVEMARSRLRAGLELQRKDNLVAYLQQF